MARRDYPGSHHPRPGTRFEDAQEYLNQHSSRTDARWLRDDQYEFRDDNRRSRARGTAPQAFLGIAVDPTADDAEYEGVVIRQVQSGTPASQAGLKKGDILLRLDDTRLKEQQDLNTAMSYYEAGDKVYFDLFRDGGRKTIAVTLRDRQNTRSQSGQLARQGGQSRQSGSNAFLGAAVEPAPDDSEYEGLVIQHIQSGGPAEQAGLQEDDILLRLDDMLLKERADLNEAISYYDPGEKVYFQVMRDGSRKTIAVTLSDRRDMGSQSGQMARERWQSRQSGSTAFLGAAVEPTPDDSEYEGLVIQRIQSGGPAEQAGLQQDDILLRLDDMRLKERADLNEAISYYDPGEKVYFQVMRDGSRKTIAVTLRARPAMRSQAEAARGDRATRLERAYRGADRDEQRQAQSTQEQAFLGVRLRELTDELKRELKSDVDQGAFVAEVIAGSPAAMAGLRAGDVITTIDGQDISEPRQAQQAIHNAGAGSEVTLEIARGNETRELTATLGEAQVDLIVIFPMPGLFGPGETEETGRAYHSPEPTTGSDSNEEIRRLNQKIDQMSQEIRDLRRRLSERP
jgi:S1-C subfamily serine protease